MEILSNCIFQGHGTVTKTEVTCLKISYSKTLCIFKRTDGSSCWTGMPISLPTPNLAVCLKTQLMNYTANGGNDPKTTPANVFGRKAEKKIRDKPLKAAASSCQSKPSCILQSEMSSWGALSTMNSSTFHGVCLHEFAREYNDGIELRKRRYNTGHWQVACALGNYRRRRTSQYHGQALFRQ